MNPGELRHRIKIFDTDDTEENEAGEKILKPQPITDKPIWAKVEPLKGREFIEARKTSAELTYKVTIRFRKDIHPTMIIEWRGKTLEIDAPPINVEGRDKFLEIMCLEKVSK